jgi:hypothetical protein
LEVIIIETQTHKLTTNTVLLFVIITIN